MSNQELVRQHDSNIFSSADSSSNKTSRLERLRRKLMTAVTIGNVFKRPVQLVYKDHLERFTTKEAVVIAVTDRFAVLRGGRSIQQSRIRKVIL